MQVDYLIIGQGIAGTVLSYTLLKRGKKVLVVDSQSFANSSKAAAGIFNPITGKRLVKTWQADLLFPYIKSFYQDLEKELKCQFLHLTPIYRPFLTIEEQNSWISQTASPQLRAYTNTQISAADYKDFVDVNFGGMEIKQAGYVDIKVMLQNYATYLGEKQLYRQEVFSYEDIVLQEDKVCWHDIEAKKVLFCEGVYGQDNPFFHWLPFKPVKGEVLVVSIPGLKTEKIINRGVFVLPVGNGLFKVGSTYYWRDLTWEPSREGREELLEKLRELIKLPFEVVAHEAGIRPASADRRPFIGLHPEHKTLGIFNGLGSKGTSVAPYYAQHFFEHLDTGKELEAEVHINRYFSLYYKTNT